MDLKTNYAINHSKIDKRTQYLNKRLFSTYNRITQRCLKSNLSGTNIDLGSGDKGFSAYCESIDIKSYPYDYPDFDLEQDKLNHDDNSIDFVTLNAVIEHIQHPEHIFKEIYRVLKTDGLVFIRTPNWQMDFKNFYNDPTHVKPYTPQTLRMFLRFTKFKCLFLEPGLIEKSWIWWKLPAAIKWRVSSLIKGGTKSILCVGQKDKSTNR